MKLFELFLDKFSESTLFEMAKSRKDAKNLITGLSPQIIKHLVKLFVFNSPENKSHWINEIDNWLLEIDDIYLKPSNKKLDWQTIYDWIVFDSSPYYSASYINSIVTRWKKTQYMNVQVYEYDAELVLNQILKIIESVCKDIEKPHKFESIQDYFNFGSIKNERTN
jgi:hypothetical protein